MERETPATPASRICVGKGGDGVIWTDGTGVAACGSTEDHRPHSYSPAQRPAREDKAMGPRCLRCNAPKSEHSGIFSERAGLCPGYTSAF